MYTQKMSSEPTLNGFDNIHATDMFVALKRALQIDALLDYTGYRRDYPHVSGLANAASDAEKYSQTLAGRVAALEENAANAAKSIEGGGG